MPTLRDDIKELLKIIAAMVEEDDLDKCMKDCSCLGDVVMAWKEMLR